MKASNEMKIAMEELHQIELAMKWNLWWKDNMKWNVSSTFCNDLQRKFKIHIYFLPVSNGMKSANSAMVGMKYKIEASKKWKMGCKQWVKWNLDGDNKY